MAYGKRISNGNSTSGNSGGNLCPECGGTLRPSKFGGGTYCSNYKPPMSCKYKGKGAAVVKAVAGEIAVLTTLSDEQRAGLDALLTGRNVMGCALAGTGKTTWVVQGVRVLSGAGLSILCLAFAKRDQLALESRVCGKATVKTSNAAGWNILSNYCRRTGGKMVSAESPTYVSRNILEAQLIAEKQITIDASGKREYHIGMNVVSAAVDLVDKARNCLPLSAVDPTVKKSPDDNDYAELMGRFGIEVSTDDLPEVISWAHWLFREMADLRNLTVWGSDFTGQIFLPSYHNLKPDVTFDRVFVDECQDQSYATRRIAELHVKTGGRIIAVGDRHQAIYGWRGADADSMNEMYKLMVRLGGVPVAVPLTLCRRCATSIIEVAQTIVPTIKALPNAPAGEVVHIPTDAEFLAKLTTERRGLVLCRANAPAVSLCLKLLAVGVPAALVRSDIVKQLLNLVDKCSAEGQNTTVADLLNSLNEWQLAQLAKLAKRQNAEKLCQVVRDKAETITALAMGDGIDTTGDVKRLIDRLFPAYINGKKAEDVPMEERASHIVLFSTVHGAKGGEADTVYLYSPEKAKGCLWDAVWSDATDRDNVLYVGITRAMRVLVFAGMKPTLARMSDLGHDADGRTTGDEWATDDENDDDDAPAGKLF